MKSKFQKLQPKIINNRNYKYFNKENFKINLMHVMQRIKINLMHEIQRIDFKNIDCEQFENLFMRTKTIILLKSKQFTFYDKRTLQSNYD